MKKSDSEQINLNNEALSELSCEEAIILEKQRFGREIRRQSKSAISSNKSEFQ